MNIRLLITCRIPRYASYLLDEGFTIEELHAHRDAKLLDFDTDQNNGKGVYEISLLGLKMLGESVPMFEV